MANCYIIIKHLQLPVMDLMIMPEIEIIRHIISQRHENLRKYPTTEVLCYIVLDFR